MYKSGSTNNVGPLRAAIKELNLDDMEERVLRIVTSMSPPQLGKVNRDNFLTRGGARTPGDKLNGPGSGGGGGVLEVDRAAALRFIMLSMLRKPLLRPGVSDCSRPENLMNSGCTRWICSLVHPSRPITRSATRPLVSCASDSPTKRTLPSASRVACTCTVERQPGTLFVSTSSALSIGGSFLARKSCGAARTRADVSEWPWGSCMHDGCVVQNRACHAHQLLIPQLLVWHHLQRLDSLLQVWRQAERRKVSLSRSDTSG